MKKRTVDILDQARDMELKLNWQLFKFEQDARLWNVGTSEWIPGDPIHVDVRQMAFLWYSQTDVDWEEEESPFQHVREMVEFCYENDALMAFYVDNDFWLYRGCRKCEVLWISPSSAICWCCGESGTTAMEMYEVVDDLLSN